MQAPEIVAHQLAELDRLFDGCHVRQATIEQLRSKPLTGEELAADKAASSKQGWTKWFSSEAKAHRDEVFGSRPDDFSADDVKKGAEADFTGLESLTPGDIRQLKDRCEQLINEIEKYSKDVGQIMGKVDNLLRGVTRPLRFAVHIDGDTERELPRPWQEDLDALEMFSNSDLETHKIGSLFDMTAQLERVHANMVPLLTYALGEKVPGPPLPDQGSDLIARLDRALATCKPNERLIVGIEAPARDVRVPQHVHLLGAALTWDRADGTNNKFVLATPAIAYAQSVVSDGRPPVVLQNTELEFMAARGDVIAPDVVVKGTLHQSLPECVQSFQLNRLTCELFAVGQPDERVSDATEFFTAAIHSELSDPEKATARQVYECLEAKSKGLTSARAERREATRPAQPPKPSFFGL